MSDLGGHGGASPAETRTPLVLLTSVSAQLTNQGALTDQLVELEQTDLANLLSAWTGVQPPRGSLGLLHPPLAGLACGGSGLASSALLSNNWLSLLELRADALAISDFNRSGWSKRCLEDLDQCYHAARQAQTDLVYASAEYSLAHMLLGLALGCLSCCLRLPSLKTSACWLFDGQGLPSDSTAAWRISQLTDALLSLGTCLAPLLIHSSTSLIEEEHQLWYFACTSLFVCLLLSSALSSSRQPLRLLERGLPLAAFRLARCFNQTGDKWAHLPDLDDHLRHLPLAYAAVLGACVCLAGQFIHAHLSGSGGNGAARRALLIGCCGCAVWLRCRQLLSGTADPLVGFLGLLLAAAWTLSGCRRRGLAGSAAGGIVLHQLVLSSKPANCAVLCLHCLAIGPPLAKLLQSDQLCSERRAGSGAGFRLVLAFSWLGQALYFQLGQSNSLATADIGASFAGLPFNSMTLSGCLLILSTWTGQLFYLLLLVSVLQRANCGSLGGLAAIDFAQHLASWSWCCLALLCIVQRHHLFVWTVYAPKYCYCSAYLALLSVICLLARLFQYISHCIG